MVAKMGKIGFVIALGLVLCMALVSRTFGQSVQRANPHQADKAAQSMVRTAMPQDQQVVQLAGVQLDSYQQSSQLEGRCWGWWHRCVWFHGGDHHEHEGDHDDDHGDHDDGNHDSGDGGDDD